MIPPACMTSDKDDREPLLKSFAEIEPEPISWLWEPYIPRRRITILEGDASVGKTYLGCKIAAMVSSGEPWPWSAATTKPRRGSAIIMSREDGLADTLRPRLELCGADLARVHTLTEWKTSDGSGAVTLKDIDVLGRAFKQVKPALVVIDPLQAFIGADVHMGSANKTRPVLAALGELAEKHDTAIVIVRHLTKSQTTKVGYRGMGGVDFTAAVRSLLLAGRDPQTGEHAIVHIKNSAGALGPSLGFAVSSTGLEWTGLSEATAARLLARDTKDEEESPRERAKIFLREMLKEGPRASKEIQAAAATVGISPRTMERAQEELGVTATPRGRPGRRGVEAWFLSLPNLATDDDSDGGGRQPHTVAD